MASSRKTRRLAAGIVVAGVAVVGALTLGTRARRTGGDADVDRGAGTGALALPTPTPVARQVPETPEEIAKQVEDVMASWRTAIGVRDADTVVKLDIDFAARPARYVDALVKSAETEPDARVRAFSTKVLGKLHKADLAGVFEHLLEDDSPFVRQNAAWALGELADQTEGRLAARHALAELRQVGKRDAAGDVRSAAKGALARLE